MGGVGGPQPSDFQSDPSGPFGAMNGRSPARWGRKPCAARFPCRFLWPRTQFARETCFGGKDRAASFFDGLSTDHFFCAPHKDMRIYSRSSNSRMLDASIFNLPSCSCLITFTIRSLMGVGTFSLRPHSHTTPLIASTSQGFPFFRS